MEDEKVNEDNLIQSKNYVIKNNYWNNNHEFILTNIVNNCSKFSKEHQKNYLSLRYRLKKYRIPIIIISSMGGFLSLANSGYVPIDYNKWVSLFVGFTNLMVTVISLIENFKKIDDTMNKSYISYLNFKKLHDEVAIILKIPPNERESNGYDIVMKIYKKYELCLNDAPVLNKLLYDALDINLNIITNSSKTKDLYDDKDVIKTIKVEELSKDFDNSDNV